MFRFALAGALALACTIFASGHPASARDYNQVICDNEPDPGTCEKIHKWYTFARTNDGTGCCGLGDAYWTDEIRKVTPAGLYVVVTDPRSCKSAKPAYDDESGQDYPDTEQQKTGCIRKPDFDGKVFWIPNDKIDRKGQGNPTGHVVTFINPTGNGMIYDPDGKQFPMVYCFFPGVGG